MKIFLFKRNVPSETLPNSYFCVSKNGDPDHLFGILHSKICSADEGAPCTLERSEWTLSVSRETLSPIWQDQTIYDEKEFLAMGKPKYPYEVQAPPHEVRAESAISELNGLSFVNMYVRIGRSVGHPSKIRGRWVICRGGPLWIANSLISYWEAVRYVVIRSESGPMFISSLTKYPRGSATSQEIRQEVSGGNGRTYGIHFPRVLICHLGNLHRGKRESESITEFAPPLSVLGTLLGLAAALVSAIVGVLLFSVFFPVPLFVVSPRFRVWCRSWLATHR